MSKFNGSRKIDPKDTPLAHMQGKSKFIPKAGYNVVGLDSYEKPGAQLFIVGHYEDEASANAARDKRMKKHPGEKYFVYGPDTK